MTSHHHHHHQQRELWPGFSVPARPLYLNAPNVMPLAQTLGFTDRTPTNEQVLERLGELTRRLHARCTPPMKDQIQLLWGHREGAPIQWGQALVDFQTGTKFARALTEPTPKIMDELRELFDYSTKLIPVDDYAAHCMQEGISRLITQYSLSDADQQLVTSLKVQHARYYRPAKDERLPHQKGGYLSPTEADELGALLRRPLSSRTNHAGPIGESGFVWTVTGNGFEPLTDKVPDMEKGYLLRDIPKRVLEHLLHNARNSHLSNVLTLAILVKSGHRRYDAVCAQLRAEFPPDPGIQNQISATMTSQGWLRGTATSF